MTRLRGLPWPYPAVRLASTVVHVLDVRVWAVAAETIQDRKEYLEREFVKFTEEGTNRSF